MGGLCRRGGWVRPYVHCNECFYHGATVSSRCLLQRWRSHVTGVQWWTNQLSMVLRDPIRIQRRAPQDAQNRHLQLVQNRATPMRRRLITTLSRTSTLTQEALLLPVVRQTSSRRSWLVAQWRLPLQCIQISRIMLAVFITMSLEAWREVMLSKLLAGV